MLGFAIYAYRWRLRHMELQYVCLVLKNLWRLQSMCIDSFLSAFLFSCLGLGSIRIGGIFMLGGRLVIPIARLFVLFVLVTHWYIEWLVSSG